MARTTAIERTYGEHLVGRRDVSLASFQRQRAAFRARFGRWLPADRGAPVLELGCGYGAFLHFLRGEGYANATGVDVDVALLDVARRFGLDNTRCVEAGAYLEAHPGAFAAIVALDMIEHLAKERIPQLLGLARAALRPGGVFILQAPNADGPFGARYRYEDFTHTVAFTAGSIRQVLTAAGFSEVKVYSVEPVPHGIRSLARWALWQGIKRALRLYLTVETGSSRGALLTQTLTAVARRGPPKARDAG